MRMYRVIPCFAVLIEEIGLSFEWLVSLHKCGEIIATANFDTLIRKYIDIFCRYAFVGQTIAIFRSLHNSCASSKAIGCPFHALLPSPYAILHAEILNSYDGKIYVAAHMKSNQKKKNSSRMTYTCHSSQVFDCNAAKGSVLFSTFK